MIEYFKFTVKPINRTLYYDKINVSDVSNVVNKIKYKNCENLFTTNYLKTRK